MSRMKFEPTAKKHVPKRKRKKGVRMKDVMSAFKKGVPLATRIEKETDPATGIDRKKEYPKDEVKIVKGVPTYFLDGLCGNGR